MQSKADTMLICPRRHKNENRKLAGGIGCVGSLSTFPMRQFRSCLRLFVCLSFELHPGVNGHFTFSAELTAGELGF